MCATATYGKFYIAWGLIGFDNLAAWELASFLQHPRSRHPTLSSLTNDVLAHHPLRALAMLAWLAAGVVLARP